MNIWKKLRSVVYSVAAVYGEVKASMGNNVYLVQTPAGGKLTAFSRETINVGSYVFVRDGNVIWVTTSALPYYDIEM